jgi:hypothetical protein
MSMVSRHSGAASGGTSAAGLVQEDDDPVKFPVTTARTGVSLTAVLLTLGLAAPDATAYPEAAATRTPAAVQQATIELAGQTVRIRLHRAVTKLPVATELRRGYDRDKFRHWIDANDDCQDTRDEVLDAESVSGVSGCDITTGEWSSYYDGEVWTDSSDVDIDHLVPLAEAWDSGARRWTAGTRTRYANDLRDPRPLVAVTDNVNQSKSDQDPAEWMPELGTCRYVREWVAVKIRWRLTVNRPEKRALRNRADTCANTFVEVRRAKVVRKAGDGDGGTGATGSCAPGYSPCVPPPPPDLDCADLDGPIRVTGSDPHNLDGDGDGWGCES